MYENELFHHGVKGQHWGVRRYQNEDGSLTSGVRKKLGTTNDSIQSKYAEVKNAGKKKLGTTNDSIRSKYAEVKNAGKKSLSPEKKKKLIKAGAIAGTAAIAAIGYKQYKKNAEDAEFERMVDSAKDTVLLNSYWNEIRW